jgi:hypothetical protein
MANQNRSMLNEGDWVEGEPRWWWKYVFPAKIWFWTSALNEKLAKDKKVANLEPEPDPWLEGVTAEILESLTMLHTAKTVREEAVSQRLKQEAVAKINSALKAVK